MIVTATAARNNLFRLIDETVTTREPTYITSRKGNVVMLSESDYRSIAETLYLSSIPGMREKILDGLNTPLSECVKDDDE